MQISTFSIRRPVTVSMLFIGIAFLGLFAFTQLGIDLLPNINVPHLLVQTTYPNATPEEVEKQITEPLESAVGTVPGIKKIISVSKEGLSVISADFVWGTDMKYALLSLREKLDNMSFALPREAGRPTIIRSDPSATPIMTLVLSYRREARGEKQEDNTSNVKGASDSGKFSILNSQSAAKMADKFSIAYVDHSSDYEAIKRLIDLKEAGRILFKRRFEQIDGVAQAVITGGLEREILIQVDPAKLNLYNITFDDVERALTSSNLNMPAGSIMKGLFRYSLRTLGEFQNPDDIKKTIVKKNLNASAILIKDIAIVTENFKEREGLTRYNGNEAIGILIYKEPDANTVSIAQIVKETINSLHKEYPEYGLLVVSDQSSFIDQAISNVKQEILYGGILAVIVLFFFLGNIRHIFIIGITIPASLVITILLLYLFNINFNIISLGGLAVGIGMLLDNAIIVIENNTRYREMGETNRSAVVKGTKEVSMPIIASTLTTIAVFLPLIFVRGVAGELFRDQSYAIAFSLTASIITALTLIPMLDSRDSFRFIKNPEKYTAGYMFINSAKHKNIFKKLFYWISFPFIVTIKSIQFILGYLYVKVTSLLKKRLSFFFNVVEKFMIHTIEKYERLLEWALDNKKAVLIITFALIALTILAVIDMKKEFIPQGDMDEFVIEFEYPAGTSLRGNAELTSKIENAVLSIPHVNAIVSNIGRVNEFDFLNKEQVSVNKTNLIVKLDSYQNYRQAQSNLRNILENLKGINYSFQEVKTSYSMIINPSENDIAIKIKNKDIDKAFIKAGQILEKINSSKIDGLRELRIGVERGNPEYTVTIDREKCLAYGVSIREVANQISNMTKGKIATYFSDFDKKVGINIKAVNDKGTNIQSVLDNYIISENSKVPLKNLVNYNFGYNYNEIWREDQSRTLYLYARVQEASIDDVIEKINNVISQIPKSNEEIISVGGINEEIRGAFSALYIALIISVLLMYMVLASEFESFIYPFIILFSVPLGLIGGILLLYIFGESISIISIMGLLILIGIADNDAVVKMEFILRKRKEGLSVKDAILEAGKDRFRPIVMNSFTVIFALIPMMIGIGAATQLRVSLSLSVVGGLITSTFLTLIIIPVLYTYADKFSKQKNTKT
ncbi:MAG: efflux RND transporter permease subunit [Melioribacteraceae bacterium]|nr:efflux RND transporter permease subunit [Melioribacteraceae bacterium]